MNISLKKIKELLQQNLTRLDWTSQIVQSSGQVPMLRLDGLSNIRSAVEDISKLGLFHDTIQALKSSAVYTTGSDQITLQTLEGKAIEKSLQELKTLGHNFFVTLSKVLPTEDENSINIKLPPVSDFDELSKVSREFHIALTQVIFSDEINGQTKIESVENGSIWLNVFVGATAVGVIASLVWASAVIFKKIQEGKLLVEQVRGLKVKNESLEDILKAQKKETELMIEAEAEHIQSEHFRNHAPENIERIKNSISLLADLIGKGAEIHPALVAPEQVSNLFPDPTNLIGLESKIKKLGAAKDN